MANFPLPALPPQFNPAIPFTQVPDATAQPKQTPVTSSAPVFNPSQPFEAVPDAPPSPASRFDPNQAFQKIFSTEDVAAKSKEELVADKDFNPTDFFANNPEIVNRPENLKKLLETYRARREEGIQVGETAKAAVKSAPGTLKKFAEGAYHTASNLFILTGLQDLANDVLGAFESEQVKEELRKEGLRASTEAQAKAVAATETSATGISDLARTGVRKIFGKSVKDQTDQELLQELATDAAFQTKLRETTEGRGEFLKGVGLDADELAKQGIVLDPGVIEGMSLVDPLTLVATGGVGKIGFNLIGKGGKVLATVPTVQAGIQVAEKLGTAVKPILESLPTAGQVVGKPIEVAGKGIALASKAAPATGAVVGTVKGGPFGTIAGIYAGERLAPRLARVGESVQAFGQQVAGKTALSPALASIVEGTKLATPLLTGPLKGAAIGTAVALPLAAAAEGSEQAGTILGGGLGLGTVGGLVQGTARVGGELAAKTFFDPHSQKFKVVPSPDYGVTPYLDEAHRQNLAKRSVNEKADVTTAREIFRPLGGEIYSVDKATFGNEIIKQLVDQLGRTPTSEELASIQGKIDAQGYFDFERPDGRKVVLLNADSNALWHESSHLTYALLPDQVKAGLADAVRTNYSPEEFSRLKSEYEGRLGSEISDAKFIDELIAENFSAVFNNVPITQLKAPAGFLRSLGSVLAQVGEKLGVDATQGRTSPDLSVPLTQKLRAQFEKAARDLLKAPAAPEAPSTPPAPAEPAPAPTAQPARPPVRNTRVTKGEQDALARRAEETGVTEARALAATDADVNVAKRVNEVSAAMEAGNPVLEIEHLGIADTGTPGAPTGRTPRRGIQEAGYAELERLRVENRANAPADLVNLHQKTFTPVRWTSQGKTPTLIAMSADKVISNLNKIAKLAAEKGAESLLPYEIVDGKLTDASWRKALADVQAYAENQANGFRGDGQRLTRPAEGELSIPSENRDYVPTPLSPEVANFANLVQGLATPETAREIKGKIPGNIKGQILAEANKRELLTPADIKPKNVGKQAFKSFPGRSLAEVNPLRNELVSRGVNVRELLDVTERIRAKDIASVKQRPELNFKAPVTDVIRGGFLPSETNIKQIGDELRQLDVPGFQAKIKEWGKSLTNKAFEIGQNVKSLADVQALRDLVAEHRALFKEDLARGDLDAAGASSVKAQFFQEAIEAATGEGNKSAFIRQYVNPDYKPPFPTEGVQFLPKKRGATEEQLPAYLKFPEQGYVSAMSADLVRENGVTPQFWLNAKTGKVLLASEGHVERARDLPGIPSGEDAPVVYDAMDAAGWLRGVAYGDEGRIQLDGTPELSRSARQTLEDIAFRSGKEVIRDGETVVESPKLRGGPDFLPAERKPNDEIRNLSSDYMKSRGQDYKPAQDYVPVNIDLAKRLADFYENAKSTPDDSAVAKSYQALADETMAQYDAMKKAGYTIEPFEGAGEPYKSSAEAIADIRDNKHLFFLKTENAFGAGERPSNNPLLQPSGVPGLVVNDIFRAVHDFFGHGKEGYSFGPRGELNAWRAHSEMFSPEAQGALAAETLAQNSWVNFGKHLRDESGNIPQKGEPGYVELAKRPFGEQKNILVPPELIAEAKSATEPQFLPRKPRTDEQGRPLTKGGLVDYNKLAQAAKSQREKTLGDLSKYDVPEAARPASNSPTGWILPDKTFVPLQQSYHEQFLAENSGSLNRKFKTKFSNTPDVEERLAALNAGFTRVRHQPGTGAVHVEVNRKFWPKQKSAILDQLLSDPESIDSVSLTLLNDTGQSVNSRTVKLFESVDRVGDIQGLIEGIGTASRGAYLPVKDMTPKDQKAIIKSIQDEAEIKYPEAKVPQFVYNDDGSPKIVYGGPPGG